VAESHALIFRFMVVGGTFEAVKGDGAHTGCHSQNILTRYKMKIQNTSRERNPLNKRPAHKIRS
jgi:hypothetical protein